MAARVPVRGSTSCGEAGEDPARFEGGGSGRSFNPERRIPRKATKKTEGREEFSIKKNTS
jgi:hypothetical protein